MAASALNFELTADSVGIDRDLAAAQKKFQGFGSQVSADLKSIAGSFASYEAFKGLVGHTVESAKEIRNFSKQANISTDEVQRLQKAAGKVDLEFENVQSGMTRFDKARVDAAQSNQEFLDTFNKYGITLQDLMDPQTRS